MKLYLLDPLALLGVRAGYNRKLDRHDFDGTPATNPLGNRGHIPDWAHEVFPNQGELKRFSNLTSMIGDAGVGADVYGTGTKQNHPLGTMAGTRDGRIYRYSSAGAADLVAGTVQQSAAPIALHLALTSVAQAIGDGGQGRPIVVTPGATAGAANLYAEGMLTVDTAPSAGYNYRISGHAAITASVAFNLYLDPDDLVQIAFSTATRYGLHHNPYKTVIQCPTTVTALQVGVAPCIITANTVAENYGWLQSRGPAAVLINGTPAVGSGVVASVTTAGAVDAAGAVALEINYRIIGRMQQLGVSTKFNEVFLTLD